MSDISSGSEPVVDLGESTEPVDSGEQTVEVESPAVWEDFETYADQIVEITVDGESQHVPLAELRDGYQRQADYTRKTQTLAQEREDLRQAEALWRAIQEDPDNTLKVLQAAFIGDAPTEDPEDEFLTDEQKTLKELQSRVERFEEQAEYQQYAEQLDAELNTLTSRFGLDEAAQRQLVDFAVEHQYGNLTDAYARLALENAEVAEKARAQTEARKAAARGAQVVSTGTNRSAEAVASPQPRAGQTMAESWAMAKQKLGMQ